MINNMRKEKVMAQMTGTCAYSGQVGIIAPESGTGGERQ